MQAASFPSAKSELQEYAVKALEQIAHQPNHNFNVLLLQLHLLSTCPVARSPEDALPMLDHTNRNATV